MQLKNIFLPFGHTIYLDITLTSKGTGTETIKGTVFVCCWSWTGINSN